MHRDRHPLRQLEQDPAIPGQAKRLFRWLCEEAGMTVGQNVVGAEIRIRMRDLSTELGRSRTSAHEWIEPLVAAGLLTVRDEEQARTTARQGKNGIKVFRIWSLHPGGDWQNPQRDPQALLNFEERQRAANCQVSSTEPDTPPMPVSGLVNQTRQPEVPNSEPVSPPDRPTCQVSSTEPDTRRPMTMRVSTSTNSTLQRRTTTGYEPSFNEIGRTSSGPVGIADAIGDLFESQASRNQAALMAATRPSVTRRRVIERMHAAVGIDAETDWWVSGATADAVLAGLEFAWVEERIRTMHRRMEMPTAERDHIAAPQSWLRATIDRECRSRRIRFGRNRYDIDTQHQPED